MDKLSLSDRVQYLEEWNDNLKAELRRAKIQLERVIVLAASNACPPGMREGLERNEECIFDDCTMCIKQWLRGSDEYLC